MGKELNVIPAYMVRWRELYPGAIELGSISGPHSQIWTEVTRMEKSGEIIARRRFAKEIAPGMIRIPYVRMKTEKQVRRRRRLKVTATVLGLAAAAGGVGYMLWSIRYLIIGAWVALGLLYLLSTHWSNGCPGCAHAGCGR